MTSRLVRVLMAVAIIAVGFAPMASHAQDDSQEETFLAVAHARGNIQTRWNERIEITIERWSTPQETEDYINLFKEQGRQALVDAFQNNPPVGRVRVGQRLSYPLSFSRQFGAGGGKRTIRLATDRPIQGWEAVMQETTQRCAFSFMEFTLEADNTGEGYAIVGAKLTIDDEGQFHIESYDSAPLKLGSIRPGH